jgi:hypothetical protein
MCRIREMRLADTVSTVTRKRPSAVIAGVNGVHISALRAAFFLGRRLRGHEK